MRGGGILGSSEFLLSSCEGNEVIRLKEIRMKTLLQKQERWLGNHGN